MSFKITYLEHLRDGANNLKFSLSMWKKQELWTLTEIVEEGVLQEHTAILNKSGIEDKGR